MLVCGWHAAGTPGVSQSWADMGILIVVQTPLSSFLRNGSACIRSVGVRTDFQLPDSQTGKT